jgi:catechol 2,3-dioxygenase-like lactoylglutathione lyase family enzyme
MASLPVVEPVVTFHLSLNVADLGRSIDFYRVLFGVEPAKRHDDYAKFELAEPPVVFSLVPRAPGPGGSLSHLGFRVAGADEVRRARERLEAAGVCTQDQNGTVCGYARQDKVWARDPDGNFWEVYVVEEDVEPGVVRRGLEGPAARLEPPPGPVVWEHFVTDPLKGPAPHAGDSVDEVRLTGTFNAPLDEAARAFLAGEAFRVLRPGGKVVAHGLMGDRPLPGGPPRLPGLAALVSRVPARDEAVALLRSAGFVNVQAVKLTEKPWFVHDGVGLREVKLVAWKPSRCPDGETRQVLYKGPFAQATADGGWQFPRGRRVTVPAAVWHDLRLGPAAEQFLFFEPGVAGACPGAGGSNDKAEAARHPN